MHHAAEANSADSLEWRIVLFKNFVAELPVAFLQACPNIFETVCPDAVFVLVFPTKASRRDWCMILADQRRLDASRTELDAKNGLSTLNCFLDFLSIHVQLPFHLLRPYLPFYYPTNALASVAAWLAHAEERDIAAVLRDFAGLKAGDRVTLHMPMSAELPITMLACARLGVIHSEVFGGFSGRASADRIVDSQSRVLIVMDSYYRAGKLLNHKENARAALNKILIEESKKARETGIFSKRVLLIICRIV